MSCTFSNERIEQVIDFHGHSCPGLAIGIRAAELALLEFESVPSSELVAVVETDMCGVDAIQFLTGCTFGKGNLIHRDWGKTAFTFYDRTSGQGLRMVLRPESRDGGDGEMETLMGKMADNTATEEDRARVKALRAGVQERFMTLPLNEMFMTSEPKAPAPRRAKILQTLCCANCGETVMESRTTSFGGRTLCIPCFKEVEQKI